MNHLNYNINYMLFIHYQYNMGNNYQVHHLDIYGLHVLLSILILIYHHIFLILFIMFLHLWLWKKHFMTSMEHLPINKQI